MKTRQIQINLDGQEYDCHVYGPNAAGDVEITRSNRALSGRFQSTEVEGDEFWAVADDAIRAARDADHGDAEYADEASR